MKVSLRHFLCFDVHENIFDQKTGKWLYCHNLSYVEDKVFHTIYLSAIKVLLHGESTFFFYCVIDMKSHQSAKKTSLRYAASDVCGLINQIEEFVAITWIDLISFSEIKIITWMSS